MKKSRIVGTIIAAIIIVIGVFALVYTAVIVYNTDLRFLSYKNAEATISSVQSSYVDGKKYYKATYSFNINGGSYGCDTDYTNDENEFVVGDVGTIRYDANNPNNNYLVNTANTFYYLYFAISCVVVIIGIKLFDRQTKLAD